MPKVFIVGGNRGLRGYFEKNGYELTDDPFKADLFQFMGGEDVTPEIYGEKNTRSHNNFQRDLTEMAIFALAKRLDKPMVGICRGGQFLNVMCGGTMLQHIDGHALRDGHELHIIQEYGEDEVIMATSTHHQLMQPDYNKSELLAYATIVGDSDPEVVYYYNDRVLCFQPHPEYERIPELTKLYFGLIETYLL